MASGIHAQSGKLILKPVVLGYSPDSWRRPDYVLESTVDMHVARGECVLLQGENGTGKSTFLDYVSGRKREIITPEPADVLAMWNQDGHSIPARKIATSVEARPTLLPHQTIRKYLRLAKHRRGEPVSDDLLNQSLEHVGLDESMLNHTPESLSSGQRKKVGLAVVWLMRSPLVVLDEPRANLDFPSAGIMDAYLKLLLETEKRVVLLASHDQKDLEFACHRLQIVGTQGSRNFKLSKIS
jgi:ABC-type multidrug transport system ATPase subunit